MLKLKENFSEFFDFLNLDDQAKAEKFQDMLEKAVRFSQELQDKLLHGTEEEKKQLQEFLKETYAKIEEEKNKMFQKIGITEQELADFVTNKDNFTEEEWNVIQDIKQTIEQNADPNKSNKIPVKTKKFKSKNKWIQS